jgi:hypothetical protein
LKVAGGSRKLVVCVDNAPVVGQLNRKKNNHWKSAHGLMSASSEMRLQMIEDIIELYRLEVDFVLVKSEDNYADELTRFPDFLKWTEEKFPRKLNAVSSTSFVGAISTSHSWRERYVLNSENQMVLNAEDAESFLLELHDHEGVEALY